MELLTRPLRPYREQVVVAGVSGGADSVALLRALLLAGARPVVAHLDHALRPDSAQDAAWVRQLCAELGVPCQVQRVDVGAVAQRRGWNVEDAARRVRYDFLSRVAREVGAEVVLTAHTRRDQAETVLVGVLRGEALTRGVAAEWGRVRRPFLEVPRGEVEAFLRALGQSWREDPSNADAHYTRAWLRHEVMPLLETRYPALEETLTRFGRWSAQDDAALSDLAGRLKAHTPLVSQAPAVLRRYVKRQLDGLGWPYRAGHLEALSGALQSGETLHLTLPGGQPVTATAGRLALTSPEFPPPDFRYPAGWTLRTRRAGDRIRLPGGSRKLSDVLTDLKIPRAARERVPLLVTPDASDSARVQWVGVRPALWAVGAREQLVPFPECPPADPLFAAMAEALDLARQAAAAGEVPVGAVVLGPAGQVLGRGHNTSRRDGDMTRHAELAALREAAAALGSGYLSGCTLVVTLEPCPMCLGAALEARVDHLVYGAANPKAGALGGVSDLLTAHWGHQPRVTGGVRAREAAELLRSAFRHIRQGENKT